MALTETQAKIESKFKNSDGFLPYIEDIRFPMYKSLEDGLSLTLDWPIIALVGPNGTNKSSVLQAISAAPEGRSLAQFWFSTEVDDIDQGIRGRATHRFIYRYKFDRSGTSAECRKYRGKKKYRAADVPKDLQGKRDPDYWEPTKRVASDGMAGLPTTGFDDRLSNNRDRWNQVDKNVVYLDFRSELSAFDKYIHHQSFDRWTPDATQKRYKVVAKSKWVARALSGRTLPKAQRGRLIKDVRHLANSEVAEVREILGKPIASISMVEHRFFGPTGYTVRLQLETTGASYSEAHAGSGEYAVVRLVDAIRSAPERSLILLDEPEVSLHPGAQAKLLQFIEREVLRGGHQVVMSTHSPSLVAGLPHQAIKVFGFDTLRQRVVLVADGCSPTEAFAHLGHTTAGPTRPRLIVEDDLAAELVRTSLRRHGRTKLDSLDIAPFPGGAGTIVSTVVPSIAIAGVAKTSILLDGDQKPVTSSDTRDIADDARTAAALDDLAALRTMWNQQFHESNITLPSDSDHARDVADLLTCVEWASKRLAFLPGKSPEEVIATAVDASVTAPNDDWKAFWVERTRSERHFTDGEELTAGDILELQKVELANLPDDCPLLRAIADTVNVLIDW